MAVHEWPPSRAQPLHSRAGRVRGGEACLSRQVLMGVKAFDGRN
jgi:hypothetical protein